MFTIADSTLQVHDEDSGIPWDFMGSTEHENWQVLYKNASKFMLANWEFKSLSVGSRNVMEEVQHMDGPFHWDTCQSPTCTTHDIYLLDAAKTTAGPDVMWSSTTSWLGAGMASLLVQVYGLISPL